MRLGLHRRGQEVYLHRKSWEGAKKPLLCYQVGPGNSLLQLFQKTRGEALRISNYQVALPILCLSVSPSLSLLCREETTAPSLILSPSHVIRNTTHPTWSHWNLCFCWLAYPQPSLVEPHLHSKHTVALRASLKVKTMGTSSKVGANVHLCLRNTVLGCDS